VNPNRAIYETHYSPADLRVRAATPYDEAMIRLRFSLVEHYGSKRDVLDVCCGTGAYLLPCVDRVRRAVGLDFSKRMLDACHSAGAGRSLLVLGDAACLPLADCSFDFVFSFASLYHVPDVASAIREIARVLRPRGHAAFELGNQHSLNTLVTAVQHVAKGWAKPFHIPAREMRAYVREAGLQLVAWRAFQLLPMYGAPARLFYLLPLLSAQWKRILGVRVRGRMLDEWISSSWPLRYLAFRHLFIVRKP